MPDVAHLLDRKSHRRRSAPGVAFLDDLSLDRGRVHEACGAARRRLAMMVAGALQGPVFWIRPAWMPVGLHPEGMLKMADPARFLFATPKRPEDLLWTMEEVLRSGAVALAVADLPALPSLTQVRRMHLAAERGGQEGAHLSLGLLLTPGTGGAAGVETRWHLKPCHTSGQDHWQMERQRARTAPQKTWRLHRPASEEGPKINTA